MLEESIMVLRLLIAAILGGAIGYQREKVGKAAGLRTHMLIAVGATLFTLVSVYAFSGVPVDPTRIAAGVVTGVGFIGAGVIFLRPKEHMISGLTTASTIWVAAGIGVAVGSGLYLAAVACTILVLIVLLLPHLNK